MIDTIKLYTPDFEVKENSKLRILPGCLDMETGQTIGSYNLFDINGLSIDGKKAFLNTDNYNLTIQAVNSTPVLFLQLSPSKIYNNGNNFYSVGKDGTIEVINQVGKELSESGIKFNIQDSKISRLDCCRNIETEENFNVYSKIFSVIGGQRKQQRNYGTTFLWHNTQQELCIYDKIEEMKYQKKDVIGYPENVVRIENRLLNHKKIFSSIGINKISDIPGGYAEIKENYKKEVISNIFKYEAKDILIISKEQMLSELRYFTEEYKRNWLQKYLQMKGLEFILDRTGKETLRLAIKEVLTGSGKELIKKKLQRLDKTLRQAELEITLLKKGIKDKTLMSLYQELKTKFLRVA